MPFVENENIGPMKLVKEVLQDDAVDRFGLTDCLLICSRGNRLCMNKIMQGFV